MRKLVIALLILAAPATSHADGIGVGLFLGEPTGLDLNIGLQGRSALDIVLGLPDYRDRGIGYAHLTYLVTLAAGHGSSVTVPFRLGIGGAVYGDSNNVGLGVRAPLELGLRFHTAPVEIYGEIAALLGLVNPGADRLSIQGGIGFRIFF